MYTVSAAQQVQGTGTVTATQHVQDMGMVSAEQQIQDIDVYIVSSTTGIGYGYSGSSEKGTGYKGILCQQHSRYKIWIQ